MKTILLLGLLGLTLQADILDDIINYEYQKQAKVLQAKTITTAQEIKCWYNDGYETQYTTILGITIKTYKECR